MATDLLIAEDPSEAVAVSSPASGPSMTVEPHRNVETPVTSKQHAGVAKANDLSSVLSDCLELTKPRIVTMILITTIATALIGADGLVGLGTLAWLLMGTGLIAASAGAANQIWERVIDRKMPRTAVRPLPAGRMGTRPAVVYAGLLGVSGTLILWSQFSATPALAGVATWMIYVLIYTPMKTRTAWNTTVGAVAGALPVLMGYTATGGSVFDLTGWLLVGVLAAWQYPHFMAIAWMYREQYDQAGFKMTTTVEPTGKSAGRQAVWGSLVVVTCGVGLCGVSAFNLFFWIASAMVMFSVFPMLNASRRFLNEPSDQTARTLLRSSLLVLPAVLLIVTLRVFV